MCNNKFVYRWKGNTNLNDALKKRVTSSMWLSLDRGFGVDSDVYKRASLGKRAPSFPPKSKLKQRGIFATAKMIKNNKKSEESKTRYESLPYRTTNAHLLELHFWCNKSIRIWNREIEEAVSLISVVAFVLLINTVGDCCFSYIAASWVNQFIYN